MTIFKNMEKYPFALPLLDRSGWLPEKRVQGAVRKLHPIRQREGAWGVHGRTSRLYQADYLGITGTMSCKAEGRESLPSPSDRRAAAHKAGTAAGRIWSGTSVDSRPVGLLRLSLNAINQNQMYTVFRTQPPPAWKQDIEFKFLFPAAYTVQAWDHK